MLDVISVTRFFVYLLLLSTASFKKQADRGDGSEAAVALQEEPTKGIEAGHNENEAHLDDQPINNSADQCEFSPPPFIY
jgi:hypothetical protein